MVLSSALPVASMTFKGPGGSSPATNIPVVHTLLMAIHLTFYLEREELEKGMRRLGGLQRSSSSKNRPNRPSSSSVRAILPHLK